MEEDLNSIEKNEMWEMVIPAPRCKPISLKWVYKIKRNSHGDIVKYKARLVAKGYVIKYGIEYEEVFALVVRMGTIRVLLTLAAQEGWQVYHMDVKSSFLNGELQEEVYVKHDGYYVAYKPITLSSILFIFIKIKFIHCHSCVMFAIKSMSMCND